MSETAILWILGSIITIQLVVIGSLFGLLISHMKECRDFRERVAAMQADLATVKHELGDHERGIRGEMHALVKAVSPEFLQWQRTRK